MEPVAGAVIRGFLDDLEGEVHFDAVADFAAPFPVEIIAAVLGVPEADRQQTRHWTDEILFRRPNDPSTTPAGLEALQARRRYFHALVADKRAHPGDDMIGSLIAAEVTADGATLRLTDVEIVEFATLLASAGSETVTKLLGNAFVLFHRNPGEWRKVVDDPGRIPNAVEEVLRYWAPSQYQGRYSLAWPRYSVDEAGCRRVTMSNVAGFANVPVGVGS